MPGFPKLSLLVAVALLGLGCSKKDRKEISSAPRCDAPTVSVVVPYPGASPAEVETSIVSPIEAALRPIDDLAGLRSTAASGSALIVATAKPRTDPYQLASRIRTRIETARQSLPEAAEIPMVLVAHSAETVLLVLSGDVPREMLSDLAGSLRDRLVTLPGVGGASLLGAGRAEVSVELDPARLVAFGLSPSQVASALRMGSLDVPGGTVQGGQYLVRVGSGAPSSIDELGRMVISQANGAPIRISDVATIRSRFQIAGRGATYAGQPAVVLAIHSSGTDAHLAKIVSDFAGHASQELAEGVALALLDLGPLGGCEVPGSHSAGHPVLARLDAPPDTEPAQLDELRTQLEAAARGGGELELLTLVGADLAGDLGSEDDPPRPTLELLAMAADADAARALARRWHRDLAAIPGLAPPVLRGPDLAEITLTLHHQDLDQLRRAATELVTALRARTDLLSISPPPAATPEISFRPDRDRTAALGITPFALAQQIRAATVGIEATTLQSGRNEVRVVVRMGAEKTAAADLASLPIATADGHTVTLGDVATIERGAAPAEIERIDARRAVEIVVGVDPGQQSPRKLAEALADHQLPALEKAHPGLTSSVAR